MIGADDPDDGSDDGEKWGIVRVERAVVRTDDGFVVTTPKRADAGTRDVAIPPHLLPVIENHLAAFVGPERDALLFPAQRAGTSPWGVVVPDVLQGLIGRHRDDPRAHDLR
ncbi:MAG: hypothetical protein U5N53_12105 [Mycobacterium sp.]|nr:hypothetical protein [Mycobacterium sp.]